MKKELKNKTIKMRLKGMSYSQIREKIPVCKSTLSVWLADYPLPPEKLRELRDCSAKRIEKCRATKSRKREEKLASIYKNVQKEIGPLSKREIFLSGLFLYWGEGTKKARDIIAFTNTDPSMILFFLLWLETVGVKRSDITVKLHLYSDMNLAKEKRFWSKTLCISERNFRKPYVKDSKLSSLSYKNIFDHGTCTVSYGSSFLHNKITMSLKYLRDIVSKGLMD